MKKSNNIFFHIVVKNVEEKNEPSNTKWMKYNNENVNTFRVVDDDNVVKLK